MFLKMSQKVMGKSRAFSDVLPVLQSTNFPQKGRYLKSITWNFQASAPLENFYSVTP